MVSMRGEIRVDGTVGIDGRLVVFFQAEDGIRDLVRSRGLGDVYKRQECSCPQDRSQCPRERPGGGAAHPGDGAIPTIQVLSLIHI